MHKRAFHCLKRILMHAQVFPHHILKKKQLLIYYFLINQITMEEELRHA